VIQTGYMEVGIAVALVALALILSRWQKVGMEKDMVIGTIRSFVQLVAVGYALEFIFGLDNAPSIIATLLIMIAIGAYTAGQRAPHLGRGWMFAFVALFLGTLVTLGLMLTLGIIEAKAVYIIPLGGMIIGNSMTCSAQTMERLYSDVTSNRLAVETALALGKNWKESSAGFFSNSIKAGMMPILNYLRVAGLVQLPGTMTGMILGGASPLTAVLMQVIVGYMLVASMAVTGIISAHLAVRQMFTAADQLRV
jgi:putative ABC transport system permease protein